MKLRPLKRKEISAAQDIIAKHYPPSYYKIASRDIKAMFTGLWNKPYYLVAEEKGEIVGFGGYSEAWMDTSVCEVFWIDVKDSHQNKGVGTILMKKLLEKIKQKKFSTVVLTTTVPWFYARLGFKELHNIPRSDYVLMVLDVR